MNIQEILNEAQIGNWVDFNVQITEVKESKSRTKKNKMMTKAKGSDFTNNTIAMWIYDEKRQVHVGQSLTLNGKLSEYQNSRYIDYAEVKYVHPDAPQTPQNVPQSTNGEIRMPTEYQKPVTPETQLRMARCACIEASSKVIAAYIQTKPTNEIYKPAEIANDMVIIADICSMWCLEGLMKAEEPEDVPF